MTQVKNTAVYKLIHNDMTVYIGTVEMGKIEIQKSVHRNAGELFDHMDFLTGQTSQEDAKQKEKNWIDAYVKQYGRRPKYNK